MVDVLKEATVSACDRHNFDSDWTGMAARMPGAPPPGAGAPPAAEKKGEVNELRAVRNPGARRTAAASVPRTFAVAPLVMQLLKAVNTDRDSKRKRDVIKKVRGDPVRCRRRESTPLPRQVIAYMTLGIDVSRLFSDMILV